MAADRADVPWETAQADATRWLVAAVGLPLLAAALTVVVPATEATLPLHVVAGRAWLGLFVPWWVVVAPYPYDGPQPLLWLLAAGLALLALTLPPTVWRRRALRPFALGFTTFTTLVLTAWPLATSGMLEQKVTAAQVARADRVVRAVRRYEQQQGHPPDRLADLVPAYLPTVPRPGVKPTATYTYGRGDGWWISFEGERVDGWADTPVYEQCEPPRDPEPGEERDGAWVVRHVGGWGPD